MNAKHNAASDPLHSLIQLPALNGEFKCEFSEHFVPKNDTNMKSRCVDIGGYAHTHTHKFLNASVVLAGATFVCTVA